MKKVSFDKYSYIIDNKRELLRTAAVHYFRLPGFELWHDRLSILKNAGYNTIDMYLNWAFHSPKEGIYDFTDVKDVGKLLEIATNLGFFIIARPGPYINAEYTGGGLPGWLLAKEDVIPRNREDNDFKYSQTYMKYAKQWYEKIFPYINACPNVVSVQIENEYSTNEEEPEYIEELIAYARELGCSLPLSHNDMYAAGLYADIIDIYSIDNYSVTYFEQPWESFPEVFSVLDNLENNIRPFAPNSPLSIAELQAGWFDKWGGIGYDIITNHLGRTHLDIVTKTALAQGVTAFTHYMGAGGTNWDHMASTEVYTSYDFAAILSESGLTNERFYQARKINNLLCSFDLTQTKRADNQPEITTLNENQTLTYWNRSNIKDGSQWLFIRNDSLGKATGKINGEVEFEIYPQEMLILPSDLNLNEVTIAYSTIPLLGRIYDEKNQLIIINSKHSGEIVLDIPKEYSCEVHSYSKALGLENYDETVKICFNKDIFITKPELVEITIPGHSTKLLFLPEDMLDYVSIIDNKVIVGPEFIIDKDNNKLLATKKYTETLVYNPNGKHTLLKTEKTTDITPQPLTEWDLKDLWPAFSDLENTDWKPVINSLDADSNGLYEGIFGYYTEYSGAIDSLRINARHCFAVYLNNKEIYAHDSFTSISGADLDTPVIIDIPPRKQEDKNTLLIIVQSLGHNKGFEDDAANPRGLLDYSTSPKKDLSWKIRSLNPQKYIKKENFASLSDVSNDTPVICATTHIEIDSKESVYAPLGLKIEQPSFNKATIYLNDVLIGQFWADKGPQNTFFLLPTFYKTDGTPNKISIVPWYRSIDKHQQCAKDFKNANISIEAFDTLTLTKFEE